MDEYEIVCRCKKGRMLRKKSYSEENKHRMYYCCTKSKRLQSGKWEWGCNFFLWEDDLRRCPCGEGLCALVRYKDNGMEVCSLKGSSPAVFEDDSGSSKSIKRESPSKLAIGEGSSSSSQCQKCQLLSIKIKILEAKLEVAQSPEKHANTSSAILYDVLEDVSNAVKELSLDR